MCARSVCGPSTKATAVKPWWRQSDVVFVVGAQLPSTKATAVKPWWPIEPLRRAAPRTPSTKATAVKPWWLGVGRRKAELGAQPSTKATAVKPWWPATATLSTTLRWPLNEGHGRKAVVAGVINRTKTDGPLPLNEGHGRKAVVATTCPLAGGNVLSPQRRPRP